MTLRLPGGTSLAGQEMMSVKHSLFYLSLFFLAHNTVRLARLTH